MAEEKWWVGRKVVCSMEPHGNICSNNWVLREEDRPIFSHFSPNNKKVKCYLVACPLCGFPALIER
ncbi:MAG: hypothetical protein AAB674_02190 [Patescibacteria group bacterium]